MKVIEKRVNIDLWMKNFYEKATKDELLDYIFTDAAQLDLKKHLPIIGDFWESLLLGNNVYQVHERNPLKIHAILNEKTPLLPIHFQRWLEIFCSTTDEMFAGERAEFAKNRAIAIANRMMNFIGKIPVARVIAKNPLKIEVHQE